MAHKHSIQMAVFDWAGTTVDYGSLAPSEVFSRVFAQAGITLSRQEIDRPMGMEKKAHIRTLLSGEAGSAQWQARYGRAWTEADVNDLYETFEGILYQVVADYSAPIPGVVDTVAKLRELGLKIGSTTGYNSRIMEQVAPRAAAAGYSPDCVVTPDVVGSGSEATCWATIWDPDKGTKRSMESQDNYAWAALIDPELSRGMPRLWRYPPPWTPWPTPPRATGPKEPTPSPGPWPWRPSPP